MQSGINLFADQSPPPITLPALALDIPQFLLSLKKLSLYALIIISEEDFDALYGSIPPSVSSSLYRVSLPTFS